MKILIIVLTMAGCATFPGVPICAPPSPILFDVDGRRIYTDPGPGFERCVDGGQR